MERILDPLQIVFKIGCSKGTRLAHLKLSTCTNEITVNQDLLGESAPSYQHNPFKLNK